jgi:hypothetical protein
MPIVLIFYSLLMLKPTNNWIRKTADENEKQSGSEMEEAWRISLFALFLRSVT